MKFLLAIGLLVTAFSLLLVFRTWQTGYAHLNQSIKYQTELAAAFEIAVDEVLSQTVDENIASETAQKVFEKVQDNYPHKIIRAGGQELEDLLNQAGPELSRVYRLFRQNQSLASLYGQIQIDGQDYVTKFIAHRDPTGNVQVDDPALQMIAVPTAGYKRQIDEQVLGRLPVLMFSLLALLAAVYASFQIIAGRHLKGFALHLKKTAEQTGDFQFESLNIQTNDEIGLIADRYNELGCMLEKMYRTLELEVRKRTFELQQANDNLRHKMNECRYAEEQANVLAYEAMAANRAKSEFLTNMSHELRTPMNAIVGFSQVLTEGQLSDDQRTYVRMITESSSVLLELITDLLDYSKIEAGKLEVEIKDFKIGEMLAEIESIMRPAAIKKGIDFEILQCDLISETLGTDRIRLRQCLMNLISNAIKFTETGHVFVNVMLEDGDDQNSVRFDVEDTGIGIAQEKMESIFELFTQADGAMNRKYGGTGLGLAITKRLSELIGGELSVSSKEGVGSVFSVRVPTRQKVLDENSAVWNKYKQVDELNDELIQLQGEKGTEMTNGKILVAEDNPSNQKLMTILLQKMGLEVTIAEDGQKAIEKCDCDSYDLILMDMQMPNVNGYEATRQLRRQGLQTPIIAVTANAMMGDEEKCLEAGCDGYISKPIDRVKLADIISSHIGVQVG